MLKPVSYQITLTYLPVDLNMVNRFFPGFPVGSFSLCIISIYEYQCFTPVKSEVALIKTI